MKVFTRDYRITGEYHPLWDDYFEGMKPCVLDIEATGLDRSRCKVILIGLLVKTDSGVRITQFLAENHYEEAKVLDAAMEFIEEEGIGCLITFNGYAYDIPFINARLDACMDGRHLHMYHFDLYRFLRKSTDIRTRVSSMSQMSLEDHYGILSDRGDTITGKESVTLFDQYAISGNSMLEKIILTHNREDVLHLHRLMYLTLGDIPEDPYSATGRSIASDIHTALAAYGFPAGDGRFSIRPAIRSAGGRDCRSGANPAAGNAGVKTCSSGARSAAGLAAEKGGSDILRITGEQIRDPFSGAWFPDIDQPLTVTFSASTSSYEIEVPVSRHGEDLYIDISFLLDSEPAVDSGHCIKGTVILTHTQDTADLSESDLADEILINSDIDIDSNHSGDTTAAVDPDLTCNTVTPAGTDPVGHPASELSRESNDSPSCYLHGGSVCKSSDYSDADSGRGTFADPAGRFKEDTSNPAVIFNTDLENEPGSDPAGHFEKVLAALRNDPDLVNGYLILNPRTINLLSKALVLRFCQY